MRHPARLLVLGLAVVVVGLMAVGYSFIFRGVATAPDALLGRVEVPGPGDAVAAATLNDGTPVFVVSLGDTVGVLDARSPVPPGALPILVAWCDGIDAFETGRLVLDSGAVNSLGFDPDGTAFGSFESDGLARYVVQRDADNQLAVVGAPTRASGRIGPPPECPGDSERVMHRPSAGEIFDPSVALESEPPGVIWLEGTLRAIGNQALLCDGIGDATGDCADGAVARGIDPASIRAEGTAGLFIGIVRDGGITGLAHALVLSEMEER